jgi:hypothetical protein
MPGAVACDFAARSRTQAVAGIWSGQGPRPPDESKELTMGQCFGFVVALGVAAAVYSDADKLKKQAAKVTPGLWAIVVFLFLLIALPLYLLLRITTWRKQIDSAKGLPPRPMTAAQVGLVSVLSGVLLLGILGTLALMASLWGMWEL